MDSEYAGTFSRVPSRRDESHKPSGRERRGKYKANRREPRTSGKPTESLLHPDLDPNLCISYTLGPNGERENLKPFRTSKARVRKATEVQAPAAAPVETARINHGHDYNS
jgi:hypothetical protein